MTAFTRIFTVLTIAVVVLLHPTTAHAEQTNRAQVRTELENGGWTMVWGKNFTEGDWAKGVKAIGESIASGTPAPFLAWFGEVLQENFAKIERNLAGVARKDLECWILESLRSKKIIRYHNLQIDAGFATYRRWETVAGQRIPLPNWNQFYIRYKLEKQGADSSTPDHRPQQLQSGDKVLLTTRLGKCVNWGSENDGYKVYAGHPSYSDNWGASHELFEVHKVGGGPIHTGDKVYFKTRLGKYVNWGSREDGYKVHAGHPLVDSRWDASHELFEVHKVGGGPIHTGDKVYFKTRLDKYVNWGSRENGFKVYAGHPSYSGNWDESHELFDIKKIP